MNNPFVKSSSCSSEDGVLNIVDSLFMERDIGGIGGGVVSTQRADVVSCTECKSVNDVVVDRMQGDTICRHCGFVITGLLLSEEPDFEGNEEEGGMSLNFNPQYRFQVGSGQMMPGGPTRRGQRRHYGGGGGGDEGLNIASELTRKEKSTLSGFTFIKDSASSLEVHITVTEDAMGLYDEFIKKSTTAIHGGRSELVASACMYAACRREGVPRTLKEVAAAFHTTSKLLAKAFTTLVKDLNLHIVGASSTDIIPRIGGKLSLPHQIVAASLEVAEKATAIGISAPSPQTLSIACVYFVLVVSGDNIAMATVADVLELSKLKPIKSTYQDLLKYRFELLSDEFCLFLAEKRGIIASRQLDSLTDQV
jgi:transcription initiation factor TFIIB